LDVAIENLVRGGPGGAWAGVAVQLAMVRLEEELRHLMVCHAVPIDLTVLFFSLRRLSLESMDDLDTCPDFDAATLHSLDATPAGPKIARGASLGSNPFEDQVFDPMRPEAVEDLRAIAHRMAHAGSAATCSTSTSPCLASSASASTMCNTSSGSCSMTR
jgi:exocyst complex component 7